jgi:hypothetical protein
MRPLSMSDGAMALLGIDGRGKARYWESEVLGKRGTGKARYWESGLMLSVQ